MPDWHLDAVTPRDLDKILTIDRNAFKRSWNRKSFLQEIDRTDAYSYVARTQSDNGRMDIIAYVFVRILLKEMHIMRIAVAAGYQARGVATALLQQCFKLAKQHQVSAVYIEVRPKNKSAITLYSKTGFQMLGTRPNYYPETGEDALVMVKLLEVQE
ncbi:MAG: ribosomal protein S18-alanine N-acetyltransferase [Desulfobacterales bacterium]|jgi:ribosomal-protein-alanine N-acetyltransferase